MFKRLLMIILIISGVVSTAFAYESDSLLAPALISGKIFKQLCWEISANDRILSDDPEVWKVFLAAYVSEFGADGAGFLNAAAQNIKDEDRRFFVLRAAQLAANTADNIDNGDDEFTEFFRSILFRQERADFKALDIGSGDGAFLRIVPKCAWAENINLVGIDNNPDMINAAFYLNMVNVVRMNAENMDFSPESFDFIFLNYPNPAYGQAVLRMISKEASRVLRQGGGMAFTSCENPNNGFSIDSIVEMLKESGFDRSSMIIFKDKNIPKSYPLAGSAVQVQNQNPYLILAVKKPAEQLSDAEELVCRKYCKLEEGRIIRAEQFI